MLDLVSWRCTDVSVLIITIYLYCIIKTVARYISTRCRTYQVDRIIGKIHCIIVNAKLLSCFIEGYASILEHIPILIYSAVLYACRCRCLEKWRNLIILNCYCPRISAIIECLAIIGRECRGVIYIICI